MPELGLLATLDFAGVLDDYGKALYAIRDFLPYLLVIARGQDQNAGFTFFGLPNGGTDHAGNTHPLVGVVLSYLLNCFGRHILARKSIISCPDTTSCKHETDQDEYLVGMYTHVVYPSNNPQPSLQSRYFVC